MLADLVRPIFWIYPVISNVGPAINQVLNRIKQLLTIWLKASPYESTSELSKICSEPKELVFWGNKQNGLDTKHDLGL